MTDKARAPHQAPMQRESGLSSVPSRRPDFAAERDAARATRGGVAWSTGLVAGLREQTVVPGLGRPLPAELRRHMNQHFDWNFKDVRVHDDDAAADLARDRNAQALARGNALIFDHGAYAPDTPDGRDLLEHELAHVVQQQRAGGAPAALADRRSESGGFGREPPTVPYEVAEGSAPEDAHLLFEDDDIDILDEDFAALVAAVAAHDSAVRVELHGYASQDGGIEYNLNLSAQRAAAVRRELAPHLPPNSEILLFAHGETNAFGERFVNNRRVGLRVMPRATEEPDLPSLGLSLVPRLQLQIDLPAPPPGTDPVPDAAAPAVDLEHEDAMPHLDLSPNSLDSVIAPEPDSGDIDPFRYSVPPLNPRCPFAPGVGQMDWVSIVRPLSSRGGRLTSRQTLSLGESWTSAACTYSAILAPIVGPELATTLGAKSTNLGLSSAMEQNAYLENPSEADRFDQELRRQGVETTIIPVSDILLGLYEFATD